MGGKRSSKRLLPLVLALLALALFPGRASAFCGFFVSGAGGPLVNDATQVALMRDGVRTVLTMRNSYKGPPEDFALVIPVPVVLQQSQVRTLSAHVFDHLDQLTAPRLVEYWEQDPCREDQQWADHKEGGTGTRAKGEEGSMGRARLAVRVEAEFAVDEYDIVILSADDSLALEAWLRQNGYKMPAGVEPYLRPYVEAGSKFFVAKVDVKRVRFLWGRAVLSPLRFHYDTDVFSLPIRLGLANADGPQELLVFVIGRNQRYEVANYENVLIPTNLEVKDEVRNIFPAFYAALFDRTVAGKPRAVITEYAWDTSSCDPCPTPPLDADTLSQLGSDVLADKRTGFVVTRLHARYGKDSLGEDFVFRPAGAISGGHEDRSGSRNSRQAIPSSRDAFQARYVIRHPWAGPIECNHPVFGEWGAPPDGAPPPRSAGSVSQVRRPFTTLDSLLLEDAPTAAGSPRTAAEARPRPPVLLRATERFVRETRWLPFAAFALALVVVAVGAAAAGGRVGPALASMAALGAMPLLLLVARPGVASVREARHGLGLLALFELCAAALVVLTARARSALGHVWPQALVALVPVAAGVLDHGASARHGMEVARSEPFEPEHLARILATVEAESLQSITLGAACTAAMLTFAAIRAADPLPPGAPPRHLLRDAYATLALWSALAIMVVFVPRPSAVIAEHWPRLLSLGVLAGSGVLAVRLARRWPRGAEGRASHAAAALSGATLLAAAAVAVAVAATTRATSRGLDVATYQAVSFAQVRTALFEVLDEKARFAWRGAALALAAAAPVAVVIARARGRQNRTYSIRSAGALAATLTLLAVVMGMLHGADRKMLQALHPPRRDPDRLGAVADLTPPDLLSEHGASSADGMDQALTGPALLVDARGRLFGSTDSKSAPEVFDEDLYGAMGEPSEDIGARPEALVASDRSLPITDLFASLHPLLSRRQTAFRWVIGEARPEQDVLALGAYAALAQRDPRRGTLDVELLPRVEVRVLAPGEKSAGKSLATLVRLDLPERTVTTLGGRRGRYTTSSEQKPLVLAARSVSGASVSPAHAALHVAEVVLAVPARIDAGAVTSLMLDLVRERRSGRGKPALPTFVITTDIAALGSVGAL